MPPDMNLSKQYKSIHIRKDWLAKTELDFLMTLITLLFTFLKRTHTKSVKLGVFIKLSP